MQRDILIHCMAVESIRPLQAVLFACKYGTFLPLKLDTFQPIIRRQKKEYGVVTCHTLFL